MPTIKANEYQGLRNVDWEIPEGLSVLVGPSGGGKSRLLSLLTEQTLPGYHGYADYDLSAVKNGSLHGEDLRLSPTGHNLCTVLRNWEDVPEKEAPLQFVQDTMRGLFPSILRWEFTRNSGIDVWGSFCPVGDRSGRLIEQASHGMLVALLHLCAVAGASRGDVLSFDPFESALHPETIRDLLPILEERAMEQDLSLILATQSPTVISYFRGDRGRDGHRYDQVFIVDDRLAIVPQPLLVIRTVEWLAHFDLGDLYQSGDFGGQAPEVSSPK